jgi:hypothetical protein
MKQEPTEARTVRAVGIPAPQGREDVNQPDPTTKQLAAASAGVSPATDPTALRDRIAHALGREDAINAGYDHGFASRYGVDSETDGFVDAVLSVLPASVDRADALRWAADFAESLRQFERCTGPRRAAQTSENVGILRVAAELRRVAAETRNTTETDDEAQAAVQCTASVLRKPHGPHGWEPQPGMTPVRCPGFCNCPHPADEHSVYGCVDGCACEYLPPTGAPAGGAPQPKEA